MESRVNQTNDTLNLHFPQCLEPDFGAQLPLAVDAVESIIASIDGVDFEPLVRRSPGLRGNDWNNYLRCSIARMVHASAALSRRGVTRGRVLDYGAYFGNFSLLLGRMGFDVDAVDSYRTYEGVFDRPRDLLHNAGLRSFDFADVGHDLHALESDSYDVVLCMGVVEHLPDTPRRLFASLNRVLAPGGQLILDTPNLVHLYNRQKLARGESVMPDLETFFYGQGPFEGHHREYTFSELVWMLHQIGHTSISVESFNYSLYGGGTLFGRDILNYWLMVRDPSMRELLMSASTKSNQDRATPLTPRPSESWQALLTDPEVTFQRAIPSELLDRPPEAGVAAELMVEKLQAAITQRDEEFRRMHDHLQAEVNLRDQLLQKLQAQINGERRTD